MDDYLPKLDTTLMFGVGAAFDFPAGRISQAPRWMQRSGLEWFYRLCSEPRRLGRRYHPREQSALRLAYSRPIAGAAKIST